MHKRRPLEYRFQANKGSNGSLAKKECPTGPSPKPKARQGKITCSSGRLPEQCCKVEEVASCRLSKVFCLTLT